MLLAWTDEAWRWFKKKDNRRWYPNPHVDQAQSWNEGFVEEFVAIHIDHIPKNVQRNGKALIR